MLKYQQIANEIENYIYNNDLPKGTKLPTVENLSTEYSVSKSTIVKALDSLVLKGVVYQVQGSGIFVRRTNKKGYINFNLQSGFSRHLKDFKLTAKVLEFNLINPDEEIANSLECSTEDEVYVVKRIRYIDGKIMCYEESYYKKSIVPYLNMEIVEGSIYDYLESAFNISIGFSDRYLKVDMVGDELSKLLELNPNEPALTVFDQVYLASGAMYNFSKITYHYKNTQFYHQSSSIK